MNTIPCYVLVQITSYSFEVLGASLDEDRANEWRQQNTATRQVCEVRLLEDFRLGD